LALASNGGAREGAEVVSSAGKTRSVPIHDVMGALWALVSVMLIDLVLAGDNAIVVGLAAAGLPPERRRSVIVWGVAAATALRIAFASLALQLLEIIGLTLAGGILLLGVAWKLYGELHGKGRRGKSVGVSAKTAGQAILQIVIADVSMSLDNVLAVAGAARDHFPVLVAGLVLSVALMGIASHFVARLLARYPWLAWVGLLLIASVALRMIYQGSVEVAEHATIG
jgi:YjbE family integral membrane protein